jgi:glycosyltransferase involved in cell wall biosynthesis
MTHTIGAVRILHVVPYYTEAWAYGGIPRLASAMARALAARGHDVTVCTTDVADAGTRASARPRTSDGVDVRVFPNLSNRAAYQWQLFTPIGLRRFLRGRAASFDVCHIHACHNFPSVIAAKEMTRAEVPYVVSPNGTALRIERRRVAKLLFDNVFGRGLLQHARRVLAVTESERRQLRRAGVKEQQIALLPNPLDLREFNHDPDGARFRRAWQLGDNRLVLYLGKVTPRKGVDALVRAARHFRAVDTRIVIAGNEMGAGSAFHRALRSAGSDVRVTRVGLLRGLDRLDALAAADVIVYPSRDEIFGLVPLEALLCGRPVVVCNDSGCAEVIGRTGGGLTVPYGDEVALACAIDTVLAHSALWTTKARDAAPRVRTLFGADAVCARLQTVYEEVCA